MDPRRNPFAPGAGTPPPELAGRESIIETASIALARVKACRPAKSQLLLGLRGVGKTVLLNRIAETAAAEGLQEIVLEAPEDRRLSDMLAPALRSLLISLSREEKTRALARKALGVLRAFCSAFKIKVGDVEFGVAPESGTADSGSLETDLPELFLTVTKAVKQAGTGVALFLDEVQYLKQPDLAALIVSVHRLAQKGMPFILFGAGLPQLAALAGEAKSYAERMFDYPTVGSLTDAAARAAIVAPVHREGVKITDDALQVILEHTRGYPYFLQEWGSQTWNVAEKSPIVAGDARRASSHALTALDSGFFRVRFDRLTPREKDYVRAMAELGPGPHRSGEIARKVGMDVTAAGPLRGGLIKKGMLYSPQHGDTAFTVPMFDEFMKRSMPGWRPQASAEEKDTRATRKRGGATKRRRPSSSK